MLKPFALSLRMLYRYRLYTAFALIGLSVAVTSFWFISDYVSTVYKYDTFHNKYEQIYRLSMEITAGDHTDHYATTGRPLGSTLQKQYTGVDGYTYLQFMPSIVQTEEESFQENDFFRVSPQTLSVFSFNFLVGEEKLSDEPNAIYLSQSLALKYFKDIKIIGEQFKVNNESYTVKGVFQDWPKNSHIHINAFIPTKEIAEYDVQDWFNLDLYTYVRINGATQEAQLNQQLEQLATGHLAPLIDGSGIDVRFRSEALKDVYFSSALVDDVNKGNAFYIQSLTLAGLLVLIIAVLNFINLNLTRSTKRSKEISLKKVLGISRKQLLMQSATESFVMVILVFLLAFALIFSFEPIYNTYTGFKALHLYSNGSLLVLIGGVIFISGILGSTYSGIYLSFSNRLSFQEGLSSKIFKKGLLGFQYCIAAIVLVVTLSVGRQLEFIKHKNLGFNQEEILIVGLPEEEALKTKHLAFQEHLKKITSIQNVSLIGGGALPGEENGKDLFAVKIEGQTIEKIYNMYRIDEEYFELLDIKIGQGRNFMPDNKNDRTSGVIINEALAKSLNWNDPLGEFIWYGQEKREVIGVVKNFHNKSLHNLIEPIVFLYENDYANNILIKAPVSASDEIKSAWKIFYPATPFTLSYFDQFIGAMYEKEQQLSHLFQFFSILSLMLCGMGLFALFSLHVQQRTREMSIRKVLGANYSHLFKAIIKNYRAVIIIPIILAIPLAWYFVNQWMSEFSFNVQLGFDIYLLSIMIILVTSLAVIGYHLLKVLTINPVGALKSE